MMRSSDTKIRSEPLPPRIAELDGIRGIAVSMVLVWHYFHCQTATSPGTLISKIKVVTSHFRTGVDLFFVLSGFLIGGIVLQHYSKLGFMKVFVIRRAGRILPVYIVLLLCYFGLRQFLTGKEYSWLFSDGIPDWTFFCFLQNTWMGTAGEFGANFVGVTWSLAVEEQFYVALPIIFILTGSTRAIGLASIGMICAPVIGHFVGGHSAYVNMPCRMDALLIGVLIAAAFRNRSTRNLIDSNRILLCLPPLVFLVMIAIHHKHGSLGMFSKTVYAFLFGSVILCVITNRDRLGTAVLRSPILAVMGKYSYGLYMYHQAIAGLMHGRILGRAPLMTDVHGVIVTVAALITTIVVSMISYHFLEAPAVSMSRKFTYDSNSPHHVATVG